MAAATSELVVLEPNEHGHYPVQSGEKVYLVDLATGECTCPHWRFRCQFSETDLCKHWWAVRAALACPACKGQGVIVPNGSITYVNRQGIVDMAPLECLRCGGTGKR